MRAEIPGITRANRAAGMRLHVHRHCEERSDEAIHSFFARPDGLLRFARNDGLKYRVSQGGEGLTVIAATTQRTLIVTAKVAHLASRHPLEGSASSFETNVSQIPRDEVGISLRRTTTGDSNSRHATVVSNEKTR